MGVVFPFALTCAGYLPPPIRPSQLAQRLLQQSKFERMAEEGGEVQEIEMEVEEQEQGEQAMPTTGAKSDKGKQVKGSHSSRLILKPILSFRMSQDCPPNPLLPPLSPPYSPKVPCRCGETTTLSLLKLLAHQDQVSSSSPPSLGRRFQLTRWRST